MSYAAEPGELRVFNERELIMLIRCVPHQMAWECWSSEVGYVCLKNWFLHDECRVLVTFKGDCEK